MNFEKFESLICKLKALKPNEYDHAQYHTEDGEESVCALGWMVRWGWIDRDTDLMTALQNASLLFGVTSEEASYLFALGHLKQKRIPLNYSLKQVIAEYQHFLYYKKIRYNRWHNKLRRAWRKLIY